MVSLKDQIEEAFKRTEKSASTKEDFALFEKFKMELNEGRVRAAEKKGDNWTVNTWVKKGILLGFRIGAVIEISPQSGFPFLDKETFPIKSISMKDSIRIVPGGSSIRDGCFIGKNVTCMPPMYINVGAYVDDDTMIDSHALVGSCAQIGKRVHLSAASQIGGVLEPIGSFPVIVEDDVLIGGNCGIYEGTIIRQGAIIGAGTILTGATPVFDLITDTIYRKKGKNPLEIPSNAVVVPGSRTIKKGYGKDQGLSVYTPIIVKYRDGKTESSVELEDLLR
ncbi:2,3,4,5-tetrahydropyridine-2,6-dicarboxylate N-succinyltransferase [bacterium]